MSDVIFDDLQTRIERLVHTCHELREQNRRLEEKQTTLTQERDMLEEKHARARDKIEAILEQLKSVDAGNAYD